MQHVETQQLMKTFGQTILAVFYMLVVCCLKKSIFILTPYSQRHRRSLSCRLHSSTALGRRVSSWWRSFAVLLWSSVGCSWQPRAAVERSEKSHLSRSKRNYSSFNMTIQTTSRIRKKTVISLNLILEQTATHENNNMTDCYRGFGFSWGMDRFTFLLLRHLYQRGNLVYPCTKFPPCSQETLRVWGRLHCPYAT